MLDKIEKEKDKIKASETTLDRMSEPYKDAEINQSMERRRLLLPPENSFCQTAGPGSSHPYGKKQPK